jgi:hypothetical protein
MMSLGNSYLAQMSGDGQASGEDCWEWSATYGQDMTLSIRACEETAGTVNWSVSVTEAGGEPCTFMTGTAAGNNLSGSWSFFNCPDEELVMRESWSTDGEGHWELDLEIWDAETEAPLARPTDTPPYAFHYEQNADGSGECEELEDGALVWRMVWVVEGETVGGEFCTYVGGEIDECYDFGEGWEPELPEAPPEFEFDSELLEDENVPDVFLGLASLAAVIMDRGNSYLDVAEGEGTHVSEDCWQWSETDGSDTITVTACEYAEGNSDWSVAVDGCTFLSGSVAADGLSGAWDFFECPGGDTDMSTDWSTDGAGNWVLEIDIWDSEMKAQIVPSATDDPAVHIYYEENADGSGSCSVSQDGEPVWSMEWHWEGDELVGEICIVTEGEPDCYDFDEWGADETPETPPEFEFDPVLFSDPDVPLQFLGIAGMANGYMQLGMSYLALAEGEGTPIGDDCWEWTQSDGSDTITLLACAMPEGGVEWSADLNGCTYLTGEVDAGALSGGWSFQICPGEETVMTLDWSTDGADNWEMTMVFWDGGTEMMSIAFDQNADGSGECRVSEDGTLEWSMDWQVVGEEVTGNFCTYVDGELDECEPFGGLTP